MRIEESNGKKIICGKIFPADKIKVGSIWQSSGGCLVEIVEVNRFFWMYKGKEQRDFYVHYKWFDKEKGVEVFHEKDHFNFQCRYCPVVDESNINDYDAGDLL